MKFRNIQAAKTVALFAVSLLLLSGCGRMVDTEWITLGKWVYVNESSHVLELDRAYNHATDWEGTISFRLQPGDSYLIEMKGETPKKDCSPETISCPLIREWGTPFIPRIAVDNNEFVELPDNEGARNRQNYRVEKLKRRTFRFTYVFTDENIPFGTTETPGQVQ